MQSTGARVAVLAPRADLVNTLEYEEQAKLKLAPAAYSLVAGGDRAAFDRITLRPRMLVETLDLDLSVTLFGERLFAPIIVGPIADQRRFHADGEVATVKGASAARAVTVVSSRSSVPLQEIASQAKTWLWYQIFASDPNARAQIQDAVNARCKAICITVGAPPAANGARRSAIAAKVDWPAIGALKRGLSVPVMVKGIATPEAAKLALQHGMDGIIVSNYGGLEGPGTDALILTLPEIVDAVDGKVPVLVDGSFRRGTDILKALAFGAQSVLVATAGDVGPGGLRGRRRARDCRDAANRAGALHGDVRQVACEDAESARQASRQEVGDGAGAWSRRASVRGSRPWLGSRHSGSRVCHGARRSRAWPVRWPGRLWVSPD
jgi:4-hydroxymandelate oxidase